MGPWEEKPKCVKIESGEKHCWSHCWLRIVKCSWLYVQNISQHIPFPTLLPASTQALRGLARKMLWLTGEVSSRRIQARTAAKHGGWASLRPVPACGGDARVAGAAWQIHCGTFQGSHQHLQRGCGSFIWACFSDRMGVIKTNVLQSPDLQYWGY